MQEPAEVCSKIKQIISSDKLSTVSLLNKLDRKNRLELHVARSYDELKAKQINFSNEMKLEVEKYLLNARFATKKDANSNKRIVMSDVELMKRIELTARTIQNLIDAYSEGEEVDDTFISISRFIAKNIRLLKRQKQVKPTFTTLPWEEIEFCISIFIMSSLKSSEILFRAIITKEKILKFLQCFLMEYKKIFVDFNTGQKPGNLNRSDIVNSVILNNPDFEELYDVYNTVKNVYSLSRIESYLDVAVKYVNVEKDGIVGKLVLERALQVIGEYLKNTLDSPNVSDDIHQMLNLSAPRQLKDIITFLRNSLSHVPSLKKRMELENNEDVGFFCGIRNDLKKIEKECLSILYHQKVQILCKFMNNLDRAAVRDFQRELKLGEKKTSLYSSTEFQEIWTCVQSLKEKFYNKTEYDIDLFNKIESLMKSQEIKATHMKMYYLKMTSQLFECEYNPSLNLEILKKELSSNMSGTILQEKRFDHDALLGLFYVIYDQIKQAKQQNMPEIELLFAQILSLMSEERRVNAVSTINDMIKTQEIDNDKKEKIKQLHNVMEDIKNNLTLDSEKDILQDELDPKWKINQNCWEILNLITGATHLTSNVVQHIKTLLEEFGLKAKEKQRIYSFLDKNDFENLKSEINKRNLFETLFKKIKDFNVFSYENDMINVRNFLCSLKFKADFKKKLETITGKLIQQNKEVITTYFDRRLQQLGELVNVNNVSSTLNDKKTLLASEMLILDITEILENLSLLADNNFFLEVSSPTLTGKMLRNYLAHGDALVDCSGINSSIAVVFNAVEILQRGTSLILQEDILVGQSIFPDIDRAKQLYEDELSMIRIQLDMFDAMRDGDPEKVRQCRERGADLSAINIEGWSCAHFVAQGGHIEMFEQLFGTGFNISGKDKKDMNAFHIAAKLGRTCIAEYILSMAKQGNIYISDTEILQALNLSVQNGHRNLVKLLVREKRKIIGNNATSGLFSPLQSAAAAGRLEIFQDLLSMGYTVNDKTIDNYTPLHMAAKNGHMDILNVLIGNRAELNAKNCFGFVPLHFAVSNGHVDVVNVLLDAGAEVDTKSQDGYTPLHVAAIHGRDKIAAILIDRGADKNAITKYGKTPLHLASKLGSESTVIELIAKEVEIESVDDPDGTTPLHVAVLNGHVPVVDYLLSKGANINATNSKHQTSLHLAVLCGYTEIIKGLNVHHVKTDAVDEKGNTALHIAACNDESKAAALLLSMGATVGIKNKNGNTPLHLAAAFGSKDIVKQLIDKCTQEVRETSFVLSIQQGSVEVVQEFIKYLPKEIIFEGLPSAVQLADTSVVEMILDATKDIEDIRTESNKYIVHLAAHQGDADVLKQLLDRGFSANDTDKVGHTPLHYAALVGNVNIVELLLKYGAEPNSVNEVGDMPLGIASRSGFADVVAVLLEYEADVFKTTNSSILHCAVSSDQEETIKLIIKNIESRCEGGLKEHTFRDTNGDTPLMWAAENGLNTAIRLLLEHGADINERNPKGKTALFFAVENGHPSSVKILLEHEADFHIRDEEGKTVRDYFP